MTAVAELDTREATPGPEDIEAQGVAAMNRVKSFFEGVDLTAEGTHKNGVVDVSVYPFRHGGYWDARATVNGFAAAEINTYDQELGTDPYYSKYNPGRPIPKALYWLRGLGSRGNELEVLVVEHKAGLEVRTQADKHRVRHEIGKMPLHDSFGDPKLPNLQRRIEIATLEQLGVEIIPIPQDQLKYQKPPEIEPVITEKIKEVLAQLRERYRNIPYGTIDQLALTNLDTYLGLRVGPGLSEGMLAIIGRSSEAIPGYKEISEELSDLLASAIDQEQVDATAKGLSNGLKDLIDELYPEHRTKKPSSK